MSDRSSDALPLSARLGPRRIDVKGRTPHAVVVRDLTKHFPRPRDLVRRRLGPPVLSGVTFSVAFGEVFGILGHNGAGKTTLLEVLATLIEPTSGAASVCGHDVVRDASRARAGLGYSGAAAQAFYPRLTGARNLEFFAVLNDLPRAEATRRATTLLEEMGLADGAECLFQTYSEGMKQRLSLARALVADPPVLLLDEPSRSVDRAFRTTVRDLLRRRVEEKPGRAIVLVTHSFAEAAAICDRVCILDRGAIASLGTAREGLGWRPTPAWARSSGARPGS